ncbi:hypothetical protein [Actinoplanes sp. NPDC020271]|uniref:hypothetical protein n=1 Tax=Actinoplanes sp. NPDC020271 TaxID=3363896 RepID=UPI0037A8D99C
MRSVVDGDPRLLAWQRVREFAVPPSMIDTATARRLAGDWAGACAAARLDPSFGSCPTTVDPDLRSIFRRHGAELAAALRADLLHLAPELLRWHLPRVENGLLRPGLTVSLAVYGPGLYLVARTAPGWADADQRITLALWDGDVTGVHPHPRPHRRFRFDLHRHLWDVRHAAELRERSGAEAWPGDGTAAVHRWRAEAEIVREAEGRSGDTVFVRVNARDYFAIPSADDVPECRGGSSHGGPAYGGPGDGGPGDGRDPGGRGGRTGGRAGGAGRRGNGRGLPRGSLLLPDAATWVLPDLELLRAGLITPGQLHPLVADALVPGHARTRADRDPAGPRFVDCRGQRHRIGLVDGVLSPLDHGPEELRREAVLLAFGGIPLPCLRVIDDAVRRPESLDDIRARLDHGDLPGALQAVEALLGPRAVLRDGPLRDELARVEQRHHTYELYRSGLAGPGPTKLPRRRTKVNS